MTLAERLAVAAPIVTPPSPMQARPLPATAIAEKFRDNAALDGDPDVRKLVFLWRVY